MGLLDRAAASRPALPEAGDFPETVDSLMTEGLSEELISLEEKISQYHQGQGDFACILFEDPVPGKDKAAFSQKLARMIDNIGTVITLDHDRSHDTSHDRSLILLPPAVDWELISHRLSKSLNTKPLLSFKTNSPENALNRVKPFLRNDPGQG